LAERNVAPSHAPRTVRQVPVGGVRVAGGRVAADTGGSRRTHRRAPEGGTRGTMTDTARHAEAVVALVRRWLDEAAHERVDPAARQLAAMLREPGGLAFAVGFVDGVVRPEDHVVAAR